MSTVIMARPTFSVDQMISATDASKKFAEVRRRAKNEAQFVTDHNAVDSVILSYEDYESMYAELEKLREIVFLQRVATRLGLRDIDPNRRRLSMREGMGEDLYREFQSYDADMIPDEELFE